MTDGDGTIDLIVPVCVKQRCSVHIVYNRQERLCQFTGQQQGCRRQTDLCRADANFTFDDITADGATEVGCSFSRVLLRLQSAHIQPISLQGHSIIPISDMLDKAELLLQDESFTGFLPVPVRAGAYTISDMCKYHPLCPVSFACPLTAILHVDRRCEPGWISRFAGGDPSSRSYANTYPHLGAMPRTSMYA